TLRRAAVVRGVVVVHAAAGGILRRYAGVPAVALLAAGPDAVTTGGTALGLGGRESAQRQLEVRLGRVTVAGEDGDLVGAPGLQPQGKGGCIGRVPHAAVAGGLAGQAVAGPHGVEGHLGDGINRGRGAVAGDEV